ncbi:hypothetical protein [Propionispora vibrioides]|uniref:Uncharacterized protein n=1 Tax=Propionispora vibrioides TaxID=112903 RepID=A0A1H8Y4E1_9FIRM|nr:hypothetical protein [Propionispora vibrioides]SEP46946.1 hypothetical protein SAMN04490178_1423 [Propionispora vibrioides]
MKRAIIITTILAFLLSNSLAIASSISEKTRGKPLAWYDCFFTTSSNEDQINSSNTLTLFNDMYYLKMKQTSGKDISNLLGQNYNFYSGEINGYGVDVRDYGYCQLYSNGDLMGLDFTTSAIKTLRNVKVGDTVDFMIQQYGKPRASGINNGLTWYRYSDDILDPNFYLYFISKDNCITKIMARSARLEERTFRQSVAVNKSNHFKGSQLYSLGSFGQREGTVELLNVRGAGHVSLPLISDLADYLDLEFDSANESVKIALSKVQKDQYGKTYTQDYNLFAKSYNGGPINITVRNNILTLNINGQEVSYDRFIYLKDSLIIVSGDNSLEGDAKYIP